MLTPELEAFAGKVAEILLFEQENSIDIHASHSISIEKIDYKPSKCKELIYGLENYLRRKFFRRGR